MRNLYRRRVPSQEVISRELTRQICAISREIKRQAGILLTRKGEVAYVLVGNDKRIWIPDLSRHRQGRGRLKGLRCVHTHLKGEPLSQEDISDMVLLGLDLMACVQVREEGVPGFVEYAHIMPYSGGAKGFSLTRVADTGQLNVDFSFLIKSLEDELSRLGKGLELQQRERAILVGVSRGSRWREEQALDELEELAASDGIEVIDRFVQATAGSIGPLPIGRGKLTELVLTSLQRGSDLLIFNNDLSPAQVRSLTDMTDLKIIDRTQLILDIFARRAVTREGKIQVELAQLKYLLPRLVTKNTALSRLTGGIGGRGPGETKLEINRRRVYSRIAKLKAQLKQISSQRRGRRRLRNARGMPVISIVGYTNAGKSTLLNSLTSSSVKAGNRLFETLDPSSRRLRFPREREAIITDTVGFIRNLPESLMDAFESTLEELQDADLLLHVVDGSSLRIDEQIAAVERMLVHLGIEDVRNILVINKSDLIPEDQLQGMTKKLGGVAISAIDPPSLYPLVKRIESIIWGS